jgi:hypothetical protein
MSDDTPLSREELDEATRGMVANALICTIPAALYLRLVAAARRDYAARVRPGTEVPESPHGAYLCEYRDELDGSLVVEVRRYDVDRDGVGRWLRLNPEDGEHNRAEPPDAWTELPPGFGKEVP